MQRTFKIKGSTASIEGRITHPEDAALASRIELSDQRSYTGTGAQMEELANALQLPSDKLYLALDLETIGRSGQAAVPWIGIQAFRFSEGRGHLMQAGEMKINLQSILDSGGNINPRTLAWWMRQADAARLPFADAIENGADEGQELRRIHAFIESQLMPGWTPVVLGFGSSFDVSLLNSAFARHRLQSPWNYRDELCGRTLLRSMPKVPIQDEPGGVIHTPVYDAHYLARKLIAAATQEKRKELIR